MYVLRNLNKLDRVPDELREGVFNKLFEVAEIARFSPAEVQAYEDSLKSYRDLKNSLDTAFADGIEKGIEKVALNGLMKGKSDDIIIKLTGLSKVQLKYLKEKIKKDK